MEVPPEILLEIFQRVIPPSNLLDPTACLTMDPTWNRVSKQKKALTLVCRTWHGCAMQLLYEDVCIFRPHQLFSLVRTLESLGEKIHVKAIHITTFIPKRYLERFMYIFGRFSQLCPSLVTLNFNPDTESPGSFKSNLPIPPNLSNLSLGQFVDGETSEHILALTSRTVTKLTLCNFKLHQPLVFPLLVELHVTDHNKGRSAILAGFIFPVLQRATITWDPYEDNSHPGCLQDFCRRHGAKLKMLQVQELLISSSTFYIHLQDSNDYIFLQSSLELCPVLEHIVLHPHALRGSLHHPNILWVDIWEPPFPSYLSDEPRWQALMMDITNLEAFPRLKGVRTISSILRQVSPSIPLIFPPQLCEEPGFVPFSIEFEGLHVRHDVGRIYSPPSECFDSIYDYDISWCGNDESEEDLDEDDTESDWDDDEDEGSEDSEGDSVNEYDELLAQFSSLGFVSEDNGPGQT